MTRAEWTDSILPGAGQRWRLGTTSYVFAASALENAQRLAGQCDDIELILFDTPAASNWPDSAQLEEFNALAARFGLSYTVHIPSAMEPVICDSRWEDKMVRLVERTVTSCAVLQPLAYVWHWESEIWGVRPADDMKRWLDAQQRVAARVAQAGWVPARQLAVETLSYPFAIIAPLVEQYDFSVTLDIGHLWNAGFDWEEAVQRYGERTAVVHLHGFEPGTANDHHSLALVDNERGRRWGEIMRTWPGLQQLPLTLEVFSESDYRSSLAWLQRNWQL